MISVTILKTRALGAQERVKLATLQVAKVDGEDLHEVFAMSGALTGDGMPPSISGCTVAGVFGEQRVWRLLGRACEALADAEWIDL